MDKITKDWWKAFFLVFPILSFWLHASYFYFSNVTYSFDFVTCLGVLYGNACDTKRKLLVIPAKRVLDLFI